MQQYSLRVKSYRSFPKNDNFLSEIAKYRLDKIQTFEMLRAEGVSVEVVLAAIKLKKATLYRWRSALQKHGPRGLEPESKRPKQLRKIQWSRGLEQQVLSLRRQFPMWGKKTLCTLLKRDYGQEVSESTVGRILAHLIKLDKIKPVRFYYGHVKAKRCRVFNKHAKRLIKGMKAQAPGELIQIDHMSVSVAPGFSVKHFEAACPVTKMVMAQAYSRAGALNAKKFLELLIRKLPFPIQSIQVDGGSEFMSNFEDACKEYGIALYVIPPRTPELNGNVERANRTLRYEFYQFYKGIPELGELREALKDYLRLYNHFRPHQALKQETPVSYYQQYYLGAA
jgi:putative transposase